MEDILLNPNIAYLLLLAGSLFGLLALLTPGTGALEAGALLCLALAGYAASKMNFNGWALVLLVLSVVPFLYAIQKPKRELFLALSMLLLILGSAYLFPNPEGGFAPAVNLLIAAAASIVYAGFVWIAVRKSMQAFHAPPTHDLDALVGKMGEAKTDVKEDGSVQVASELWSAWSRKPISAGRRVKVVARNGFLLEVEAESEE